MARLKNPKAKGNSFEREVAELLTQAFGLPFKRVPNSGAFVGGSNASRKEDMDDRQIGLARGDIIPPESMSKLVIECKHRKEFSSIPLFRSSGKWREFDEVEAEVMKDCGDDGLPVIFLKGNRTKIMLALPAPVRIGNLANTFTARLYAKTYANYTTGRSVRWLICDAEDMLNDSTITDWIKFLYNIIKVEE